MSFESFVEIYSKDMKSRLKLNTWLTKENIIQNWGETASELASLLSKEISPNALARRLNVNAERLLEKFGIYYETIINRTGRQIKLTLMKKMKSVTIFCFNIVT